MYTAGMVRGARDLITRSEPKRIYGETINLKNKMTHGMPTHSILQGNISSTACGYEFVSIHETMYCILHLKSAVHCHEPNINPLHWTEISRPVSESQTNVQVHIYWPQSMSIISIFLVAFAWVTMLIGGHVFEMCLKVVSVLAGPMLGIFVLAVFCPSVRSWVSRLRNCNVV